ncbi:MAG: hypothetical protein ACKER6_00490, partial [Candidatus Hodgkinia cicadicola]
MFFALKADPEGPKTKTKNYGTECESEWAAPPGFGLRKERKDTKLNMDSNGRRIVASMAIIA